MRDKLIKELNKSLETDYNLVEYKLLKITHGLKLPDQSGQFTGKITALSMICDMLEIQQINPFYEDGIIQRFD